MEKYQVVKFVDDDFTLDVRADKENETVWLTQSEMALLFDVDVGRVSRIFPTSLRRENFLERVICGKRNLLE